MLKMGTKKQVAAAGRQHKTLTIHVLCSSIHAVPESGPTGFGGVQDHRDELFPPLGSTGMVWGGRDLRKHRTLRASPANTWLNYNTWM